MFWKPLDDAPAHPVSTSDGWTLRLREYKPEAGKDDGKRGAVLLLHGLGASHRNFDLHPHGPSLARWLAGKGRRVFVAELRGRGKERPTRTWRFSDYLLRDLPALTAAAREWAGGPVHFVGHSMGGILGLAHASLSGGADLASMTTVGTALHYGVGGSKFSRGLKWKPILSRMTRMPNTLIHKAFAPLWALKLLPAWHYRRENMDAAAVIAFHAHAPVNITIAELLELSTTFSGEGILCEELGRRLPELAERQPAPWLCLGGTLDQQCPPDAMKWTFERLSAPRKELTVLPGYGHFDLLGGRNAPRDVYPAVEGFLRSVEGARR